MRASNAKFLILEKVLASGLTPGEKLLFTSIAIKFCDRNTLETFVGNRSLEEATKLCDKTVRDSINILVQTRWLDRRYDDCGKRILGVRSPEQHITKSEKNSAQQRKKIPASRKKIPVDSSNDNNPTTIPAGRVSKLEPIEADSHYSTEWNRWLQDHDFPSLKLIAEKSEFGYLVPCKLPPTGDHEFLYDRALRWADERSKTYQKKSNRGI